MVSKKFTINLNFLCDGKRNKGRNGTEMRESNRMKEEEENLI